MGDAAERVGDGRREMRERAAGAEASARIVKCLRRLHRDREDVLSVWFRILTPPSVAERCSRRDSPRRIIGEQLPHEVVRKRWRSATRKTAVEPLRKAVLVAARRGEGV